VIIVHRLLKNDVPVNKYVLVSAVAQEHLNIQRPWQQSIASYPEDVGDIAVYWLALESPEIKVKRNRVHLRDMARKIKYDLMKIFHLFKNKDGLKNIPDK
jgi:hypothetical protein